MDLARNILKKYGWEEGKGLGKNEDGIDKALKPKLKFDTTGLGHDPGEQFTNKWWEVAYNSAANNIDVRNKKSKVKIKKNADIELSTKKKMLWKKQGIAESDKESTGAYEASHTEEQSSSCVKQLTDEELFAACGGLTAHKAARHGHKLSGKLKRLQEQEEELSSLIQLDKKRKEWLDGSGHKGDKKKKELKGGSQHKKKKKKLVEISHSEETCDDILEKKKRKKDK